MQFLCKHTKYFSKDKRNFNRLDKCDWRGVQLTKNSVFYPSRGEFCIKSLKQLGKGDDLIEDA